MSHTHQVLDTLRFFSSQMWHSKLEELKSILTRLPLSNHLYEDSSPTFTEQLISFVRLEKYYHGLQFFCTRSIFSRRENLESSYKSLQMWFGRIAGTSAERGSIMSKITMHLRSFCLIRASLIDFYHSVDENPISVITSCSEFSDSLIRLRNVLVTEDADNTRQAFEPIRISIECELNVLVYLLRAQSYIADLFFGDSLLCLKRASDDLSSLHSYLGFDNSLNVRSSGKAFSLLVWLNSFRNTVMAKYTLYWFNILMRSVSSPADVLTVAGTEDPNIVHLISNFQRASGALYIAIFFDTTCQEYPFLGHGYVLRGTVGEGPKGVESIPPIFTVPLGLSIPAADVYAIVMQISGVLTLGEPTEYDKLVYLFDEKLKHTYFIQKLESRTFLSLVYEGCKSRRDKQIMSFVSSIASLIRLQTLISQLRSR